jgi:HEPN domain-containing protein
MNPLTLEWVTKAEGDMDTAQREYRARRRPNYDAACFHAQQTAEKYLKAWLQEKAEDVPRIHNLVELVSLCIEIDKTFVILEPDLRGLDGYAVRVRYPGQSASKEEARMAVEIAKSIQSFVQSRLNLL